MLARHYRYLVAAYIQSYFENQQYDHYSGRRISQPIADGLARLINYGRNPFDTRFTAYDIEEHVDHLLLTACMRRDAHGLPLTTRHVARAVIVGLLRSVDREYTRDDIQDVVTQIERIIPAEDDDN